MDTDNVKITAWEKWLADGQPISGPVAYRWPSLRCINDALDDLREHWSEMSKADQAQILTQFYIITKHRITGHR